MKKENGFSRPVHISSPIRQFNSENYEFNDNRSMNTSSRYSYREDRRIYPYYNGSIGCPYSGTHRTRIKSTKKVYAQRTYYKDKDNNKQYYIQWPKSYADEYTEIKFT